jgi:hypothetical protein
MAYDPRFAGGVYVAAGFVSLTQDSQGRRYADIVTGAGAGGGPHVKVFSLAAGALPGFAYDMTQEFFAFDPRVTAGVRVGVSHQSSIFVAPAYDRVVTAPGPGVAPASVTAAQTYTPFEPDFAGGIYVGSGEAV